MKQTVAVPAPRPSDRLLGTLLQASRSLEKRLEESLETVDLSLSKYSAIKHLVLAGEPLGLSELASRLICVRSNITQLVDRLEADGLVHRIEDPKDRRSVRAELTPLGRERQAAGARQVKAVQDEMAKALSEFDCAELERALATLK